MADSACVSNKSLNLDSISKPSGVAVPQASLTLTDFVEMPTSQMESSIPANDEQNATANSMKTEPEKTPSTVDPLYPNSNQNNNNVSETPQMSVTSKPPRNKLLTSLILSPEEITKEIIERAEKKRPPQMPEGGDLLFQKQLTKRLAEKVVKEDLLLRPIPFEILTPPTPPKVPKLNHNCDMDTQKLLSILQDGAEVHYLDKAKPTKLPRTPLKVEVDRELEKELALKQLMEVSSKRKSNSEKNNNTVSTPKTGSKPKRLNKELANLLCDEGAINMLYDVEKGESVPKNTSLPSIRRQKKALLKKAQEVKQAILDGSVVNKGLRLRHPGDNKKKDSEDSGGVNTPAEASKIIRRHSSSSSYSSRGSSPRRISGEYERRPQENGEDQVEISENKPPAEQNSPVRASPPKKRLSKPKLNPDNATPIRLNDKNGFKVKLQTEFSNKFKSMMVKQVKLSAQRSSVANQEQSGSNSSSPSKSTQDETIWKMLKDDWSSGEDGNEEIPSKGATTPIAASTPSTASATAPVPQNNATEPTNSASLSPSISTPVNDTKEVPIPLVNEIAPLPPTEPENEILPENKNDVPFVHKFKLFLYRELMLRRIGPLIHVNIAPVSTLLVQAFNVKVLKELTKMLEEVASDSRCKAVLLTCSGKLFSTGIDLPVLLHDTILDRGAAARDMSFALKDFVQKLAMFNKPVVVGVAGPCIGLGVTMLAYCDIIFASPNAVFSTPYAKLGYNPEAAACLTFPLVLGQKLASGMLIGGKKLTAEEALRHGLINEILPEDDFIPEIIERAFKIASQSAHSMESTKVMLMHPIRTQLSSALASEATLLQQQWVTLDCQQRIKEASSKLLSE